MSSRSRRRSHSLRTHRLPALQPRAPSRSAPLQSPRHHPGQDRRAGLQRSDLGSGGRGAAAELPGRAGLLVQAGRVLSAGLWTGEASGVGRLGAALHFEGPRTAGLGPHTSRKPIRSRYSACGPRLPTTARRGARKSLQSTEDSRRELGWHAWQHSHVATGRPLSTSRGPSSQTWRPTLQSTGHTSGTRPCKC
jgi:hypothetical protein